MIEDIKLTLRNYRKIINSQNRTVGSVLKHYRMERKFTLEETAKDICSISYLCKVERDQLVPSELRMQQLANKLNINITELDVSLKDTNWIDAILKDNLVNEEIFEQFHNTKTYQGKLVKYSYYLLNLKNTNLAEQYQINIGDYYFNFNEYEITYYLYLLMNHYFLNEQYLNVVTIFYELKKFNNTLITLNSAILTIESLYYLDRISDLDNVIKAHIQLFYQYNRFSDIDKIKLYELVVIAKTANQTVLEEEFKLLNISDVHKNLIWYLYYNYNNVNYYKALEYIEKIKDYDERYYLKYLKALKQTNNISLLINEIKNKDLELKKLSHQTFYQLLKEHYLEGKDINEEQAILNINYHVNDDFIISSIYSLLLKASKNKFLYKRSVEILERQNLRLNEKAAIIYNE